MGYYSEYKTQCGWGVPQLIAGSPMTERQKVHLVKLKVQRFANTSSFTSCRKMLISVLTSPMLSEIKEGG